MKITHIKTPVGIAEAKLQLRELATAAHELRQLTGIDIGTWVVAGELDRPDDDSHELNSWVLDHDSIGRLVVRLDIRHFICVGPSRVERGLWQGAVMEGSWGDEAILVETVAEVHAHLAAAAEYDLVLVIGGRGIGLTESSFDCTDFDTAGEARLIETQTSYGLKEAQTTNCGEGADR